MADPNSIIFACRRGRGALPANVSITVAGNDYAVRFGYDRVLLDRFKDAIPDHERSWYDDQKLWLVTPAVVQQAKAVLEQHTGITIEIPPITVGSVEILEKTFTLEYLGQTKKRGDMRSAFGSVNGRWAAEFPEEVLKNFFEGREPKQGQLAGQTLYQSLCVVESATFEEIKKAYYRLARQWHPDVCQEENAAEMFRKINNSYETLTNPELRQRYDAGLHFERQGQGEEKKPVNPYGYRAPFRCGVIKARGMVRLMRFVVTDILAWDDATNGQGKVMVSHWPKGAKTFQMLWV